MSDPIRDALEGLIEATEALLASCSEHCMRKATRDDPAEWVQTHEASDERNLREAVATAKQVAAGDGGGPTNDDAAFLAYIEGAAEAQTPVTAEDVARLRRLADWAEGAPPLHWTGTIDRYETQRAVKAAQKRMEAGNE